MVWDNEAKERYMIWGITNNIFDISEDTAKCYDTTGYRPLYINNCNCRINRNEYHKVYRSNNKEKIKDISKKYRENNKERLKEYYQNYRDNNKERIKEIREKHYQLNKERIYEKEKEYHLKNKRLDSLNNSQPYNR
jgi:CRISPR/Cas system-associated endonuclease/helicase Cas3